MFHGKIRDMLKKCLLSDSSIQTKILNLKIFVFNYFHIEHLCNHPEYDD